MRALATVGWKGFLSRVVSKGILTQYFVLFDTVEIPVGWSDLRMGRDGMILLTLSFVCFLSPFAGFGFHVVLDFT
jgi:hypothetical protein